MRKLRRLLQFALVFACLSAPTFAVNYQLCGAAIVGGSTNSSPNQETAWNYCFPAQDSTVVNGLVYIDTPGSGQVTIAVVDSDGTTNQPQTILTDGVGLCTGKTAGIPSVGWNAIAMTHCPTLTAGHWYYLAINISPSTVTRFIAGGLAPANTWYDGAQPCCSWVSFPGGLSSANVFGSTYLQLTPTTNTPSGKVTVGLTLSGAGANTLQATTWSVPLVNSTVADCKVYTTTAGRNVGCAIYLPDGAGGAPHTLQCSGSGASVNNGFATVSMSPCGTLTANHIYWLAVNSDTPSTLNGDIVGGSDGSNGYIVNSVPCCTAPSPFPGGATADIGTLAVYLDFGGGGTQIGAFAVGP
jgi:hypothetical protein